MNVKLNIFFCSIYRTLLPLFGIRSYFVVAKSQAKFIYLKTFLYPSIDRILNNNPVITLAGTANFKIALRHRTPFIDPEFNVFVIES